MDTIFAIATAQGKAGVAIIRVSGLRAFEACRLMCGDVPERRVASVRSVMDGDGQVIDHALVLTFGAGASFTGEDVVELHCHGAPAISQAVLRRLSEIDGLRLAEAGEFTRRAFENGRMDLAQVEGLADLIEAETEAQRKQALRVLSGEFGERAESWRQKLIRAAALLEATIDFADEDVPEDVSDEVALLLSDVKAELQREIRGMSAAERVRSGFEVAIIGAPNVGKSTLLNALAGRDAAITSDYAGTTRDIIEVRMDLRGLPVTILDTAGIRETEDAVEQIGIARTRSRAEAADLRVFLVDGDAPEFAPQKGDIVARAKADLIGVSDVFAVSGKTGVGVTELVDQIASVLAERAGNAGLATRERHRVAMERAGASLFVAEGHVRIGATMYDLAAEDLRSAARQLDVLIGRIGVDDLLDEVFSSFCLGK